MTLALRATLIWHDEVMEDLVLTKPRRITLGQTGNSTFVVPDIGLPPKFVMVRPGNRGYLLTLGENMRGTICVSGEQKDVADLVRRESAGGFCATAISDRDWGVIDLDASGDYKLFFQFVPVDDAPQFFTRPVLMAGIGGYALSSAVLTVMFWLKDNEFAEAVFRGAGISTLALMLGGYVWAVLRQDSESQASLAFSVVLHTALLFMSFQVYDGEDPFVWPGPRSLARDYLVTRLDKEEPPEPPPTVAAGAKQEQQAAAAATNNPAVKTATKGDEGRAGGKGEVERARDPNARDVVAEAPKVQFFEDTNKKVLDNILDRSLTTNLTKFAGIEGPTLTKGGLGFGPGAGTGVGPGEGTGTRGGSKKGGAGGGGNVEGDFQTGPGAINTGGVRPGGGNCKGPNCGTGPRAVNITLAGPDDGDFGGLTRDEIERVVKARRGVFKACYQQELNRAPGLGGKFTVVFKIGGDGAVKPETTAIAGSTMKSDAVESCVRRNVNLLKFPAKGGVATVRYPFVFNQGG